MKTLQNENAIIINCLTSEDTMLDTYIYYCQSKNELFCETPIKVIHFREIPGYWNQAPLKELFDNFKSIVNEYVVEKTFVVIVDLIFYKDDKKEIIINLLKDNFIYHEFTSDSEDLMDVSIEFDGFCRNLES